ncbi:AMP-binding protein [Belnapia rosea]|uniref:AMP-binding protein n=1 Tax=Belnapia rosea TaxID=938405 RepID=UPI00088E8283|nr:AMP-binding protein [Belnapia rosea]SDB72978.1 fatty-acyl-CoA synthase [Belnapia rosea]
MSTIAAFVDGLASRYGSKTAIIGDDEVVSFSELARRSGQIAAGLTTIGIGPGDRVAIWLPNMPAWLEVAFACARLGAIVISCNTRFRRTEMADILFRSGAKALVLCTAFRQIRFIDILAEIPASHLAALKSIVVVDEDEPGPGPIPGRRAVSLAELRQEATPVAPAPETGFITFLTSGTTSLPKFALHSQAAVVRHAEDVADAFGFREENAVILTMNPLCGVLGFNLSLAALAAGAPQVLPVTFDAERVAEAMLRHKVTHTAGIDEALLRLLEVVPETPAFPSLQAVGSGSYNGDFEVFVRHAEGRGMRVFGIYGMSEVMALFARQPADAPAEIRGRAGGVPVNRLTHVRTRDPETGVLLPHGQTGELEFGSPSMMLGYLDDQAATARAMTEDGFLRTGDVGHTNADGSFTFVSRMGDALRLSGFLVSPQEIANVLEAHPTVDRCQVVGYQVASAMRPVAFVTTSGTAAFDEAALIVHCKERLAPFKAPVRILRVDEFPIAAGPNGEKVQRGKLRELAAAALA